MERQSSEDELLVVVSGAWQMLPAFGLIGTWCTIRQFTVSLYNSEWLLLIAMNRQKFIMNNRYTSCGFIRTCTCSWYIIIGMNYHIEQVPLCCRVFGQRLWKFKAKQKISYEYNAFTADLKIDKHLWEMMSTHILACYNVLYLNNTII